MDQESGITWPEIPFYGNDSCGRAIVFDLLYSIGMQQLVVVLHILLKFLLLSYLELNERVLAILQQNT